ncbi:hypothetical protein ACP275_14G171900 [Erythranthe tilingii]
MFPTWCVAKPRGTVNNLDLNGYVRSTCRKDPNSCLIIQPGGLCFDSTADMVTSTRSQASFLLHKKYGQTKICNRELGQIITHYPSRSTIGRIHFSFICFAPVQKKFFAN